MQHILSDLLSDNLALKAERKTFKLLLDDAMRESTGKYTIEATAGFFPNRRQAAFLYLRCAVRLLDASVESDHAKRAVLLSAALSEAESASWEGIDQNTKKPKPGFLALRKDKDAKGEDEYNSKLAELYNHAGALYTNAKGKGAPEVENCFTAVAQICTLCSVPHKPPFDISVVEQADAVVKIEEMIKFALRESKKKVK